MYIYTSVVSGPYYQSIGIVSVHNSEYQFESKFEIL